ncbi:MAG: zinc-ribbon domain-containing protein [Spirochaetaceae bacterium]|jgi:uncharacterized Zn finger protein (UPF0148 family)|nr:zinc-ribbon domain-containing protein [Spirochaetaceae bacterium]
MFCKNCGAQLKEGAKFCGGCGTTVAAAQPQEQSVMPEQAVQPEMPRCAACGTPLKTGTVFCANCGTKIEALPSAQKIVEPPVLPVLEQPESLAMEPEPAEIPQAPTSGVEDAAATTPKPEESGFVDNQKSEVQRIKNINNGLIAAVILFACGLSAAIAVGITQYNKLIADYNALYSNNFKSRLDSETAKLDSETAKIANSFERRWSINVTDISAGSFMVQS